MRAPSLCTLQDQHREANRPPQEGLIIKWAVFLGLMVLITLYITIGYIHAKKRIRKGLKPLAYHRVSCPSLTCPLAVPPSAFHPHRLRDTRVHLILTRALPSHSGSSPAPSWRASTRATPTRRAPTPTTAPATTSSTHPDTTCRTCRRRPQCTTPALPGHQCTTDRRGVPSSPRPRTTRRRLPVPRRRRGTTPGRRIPSGVRDG